MKKVIILLSIIICSYNLSFAQNFITTSVNGSDYTIELPDNFDPGLISPLSPGDEGDKLNTISINIRDSWGGNYVLTIPKSWDMCDLFHFLVELYGLYGTEHTGNSWPKC